MDIPKTYPIVLAHGFARFDILSNGLLKIDNNSKFDHLHYFKNIRTHLTEAGFVIRHSNVDWAGSLRKRAAELKQEVRKTLEQHRAEKVHIIGHSMGGLDARCMLFDFRKEAFHEKVASLTTISTPHHGSPFATFLVENFGDKIGDFGMSLSGLKDLTPESAKQFNQELEPFEKSCGVKFQTYAGQQDPLYIFTPLKISWGIINKIEGPNDGLVSVTSAKWKDEFFVPPVWDADHLNEVGWWDFSESWQGVNPTELEKQIKSNYLEIAKKLANEFPIS
jgi:triacylglycerol lipase